jgi:hypothetical protein
MNESFGKKFKRRMGKGVMPIKNPISNMPIKNPISKEELKFLKNLMDGMSKKKKFMTGR